MSGRNQTLSCQHGFAFTAFLVLAGCGGESAPATSAVTGVVKYKGEPVSEATVSLVPLGTEGRAATAVTDAEGKFSVQTFVAESKVDGAIPGEYAIGVMKMSAGGAPPSGTTQAELQAWAAKGGVPKSLLPTVYQDPAKSKLKVTVKGGENRPVVLELKD